MILAHIFLPAMFIVICKSQQASPHFTPAFVNEETPNIYGRMADIPTSTTNNGPDELLDRYRQFIAKSLLKLYDSCKVHDFLQNIKHNMENDMDDDLAKSPNIAHIHREDRYKNALLRMLENQKIGDVTLFLPSETSEIPKSALFYYVSISMLMEDKELDALLNYLLHEKCCKEDGNFFGTSICADDSTLLDKRNTIKKVKFHSWGGKRSGGSTSNNGRIPTNTDMGKDLGQSKIVIRTPFRPWGGKRNNFDGSA